MPVKSQMALTLCYSIPRSAGKLWCMARHHYQPHVLWSLEASFQHPLTLWPMVQELSGNPNFKKGYARDRPPIYLVVVYERTPDF